MVGEKKIILCGADIINSFRHWQPKKIRWEWKFNHTVKKIVFVTIKEYLQNIIWSILIIFFIFYTYISREGKERENKLLHTRKLWYVKLRGMTCTSGQSVHYSSLYQGRGSGSTILKKGRILMRNCLKVQQKNVSKKNKIEKFVLKIR